jgi:ketosteroid isomerase-like protein
VHVSSIIVAAINFDARHRTAEPPVKKTTFPTPQDAEAAFYEALEAADIDAMMEVWSDDEEIVCVHPGGPRLSGFDDVRASWAEIFSGGRRLAVQVTHQVALGGMMLTVHSVSENIAVKGEPRPGTPVTATNAYLRTGNGWRMILHHASPVPQGAGQPRAAPPEAPKVLH